MILTPLTYFMAATGVAECVASALEINEANGTLGRPGRVCVVPGSEIPWDACECGQVAVAFQHGPYSSLNFPNESVTDQTNCALFSEAVRFVVVLNRCEYHPNMTESGAPPTEAQQNAAAMLQQIEQFYMREAIICCLQAMDFDSFAIGATDYAVNGSCGSTSILFWLGVV